LWYEVFRSGPLGSRFSSSPNFLSVGCRGLCFPRLYDSLFLRGRLTCAKQAVPLFGNFSPLLSLEREDFVLFRWETSVDVIFAPLCGVRGSFAGQSFSVLYTFLWSHETSDTPPLLSAVAFQVRSRVLIRRRPADYLFGRTTPFSYRPSFTQVVNPYTKIVLLPLRICSVYDHIPRSFAFFFQALMAFGIEDPNLSFFLLAGRSARAPPTWNPDVFVPHLFSFPLATIAGTDDFLPSHPLSHDPPCATLPFLNDRNRWYFATSTAVNPPSPVEIALGGPPLTKGHAIFSHKACSFPPSLPLSVIPCDTWSLSFLTSPSNFSDFPPPLPLRFVSTI